MSAPAIANESALTQPLLDLVSPLAGCRARVLTGAFRAGILLGQGGFGRSIRTIGQRDRTVGGGRTPFGLNTGLLRKREARQTDDQQSNDATLQHLALRGAKGSGTEPVMFRAIPTTRSAFRFIALTGLGTTHWVGLVLAVRLITRSALRRQARTVDRDAGWRVLGRLVSSLRLVGAGGRGLAGQQHVVVNIRGRVWLVGAVHRSPRSLSLIGCRIGRGVNAADHPVLAGPKAQTIQRRSDVSVEGLLDVDGEHPKAENVEGFTKQHDWTPKCEVASAKRLDCVWTDYCSQIDLFRAVQKIISGRYRGAEVHAAVAGPRHMDTFAGASVVEPLDGRRVTQVSEPTEAETR